VVKCLARGHTEDTVRYLLPPSTVCLKVEGVISGNDGHQTTTVQQAWGGRPRGNVLARLAVIWQRMEESVQSQLSMNRTYW
jgi:hypothetical protein